MLGAGVQRLAAVAGLGHDVDIAQLGQQHAQALAGQRFVVGNDHLHGDRSPHFSGRLSSQS